jgi:Endosomal/lysosomal potassium channel TMEM175
VNDSTRLEAFSDAVFGFALTLLVVALEVPDSFDELAAAMRGFVAFAASFAVLYWIWYEHQRYFRKHPLADGPTIVLNALLLFVVLFYVYPLKFMFSFLAGLFFGLDAGRVQVTLGQSRQLLVIYGLGFSAVFAIFALMYRHAASRAALLGLGPTDVARTRAIAGGHALSVAVGAASVALAMALPIDRAGLAGFVYIVLGPLHAWHGFRTARRLR